MLMMAVFLVRSYIGGYVVSKNAALIVNAIQVLNTKTFIYGISTYAVVGIVHITAELALQKYFIKLANAITKVKYTIINNLQIIKTEGNKLRRRCW